MVTELLNWYTVRTDLQIQQGLTTAPLVAILSLPPWPPSSHFPIALRVKVQELAPAIAQRTDQWAWSCIDRATWAPEVPANPCSLSATLAVGVCSLILFSVEQTGLYFWVLTYTHFPFRLADFTSKTPVTHFYPYLSYHPPLSP